MVFHTLTPEVVEMVHGHLVSWFADSEDPISPPGVKNRALLESAVARPFQTLDRKDAYPSVFDKVAALFHGLIHNHPFHNGNKRTALVTSCVLLDSYGYWVEGCTDEELYSFTTGVAAHQVTKQRDEEVPYISEWFLSNSRKRSKEEKPLKYNQLKEALARFGFEIDPPHGELLGIYRNGELVTKVIKQGIQGFRPYHTHYIAELRKRLQLTPEYGVDSLIFYGQKDVEETVSEIIELRSEVIRRLAAT